MRKRKRVCLGVAFVFMMNLTKMNNNDHLGRLRDLVVSNDYEIAFGCNRGLKKV